MSTQLGEAYVAVRADWDTFSRTVESEGSQRVRGPFTRIGQVAAGVFTGVLALEAGRRVFDFVSSGISGASDLNENLSRTSVTFGENGRAVLAFADDADRALGQSRNAALDALNTFGGLFNTLGFGQERAAESSIAYTQLASDLASFGNTSPEEAVEALGAALRGESEPIRRYNVLLDDATLRARAMAMGIYDGVGPLDAATRAQAAYEEILAQTTAAQGDFARTSDGAANQERIRAAQMENVRVAIGRGLLPAYQALLTFTNDQLIPAMFRFSAWFQTEGLPWIQALARTVGDWLIPRLQAVGSFIVGTVVPAIVDFGNRVRDVAQWVVRDLVPALVDFGQWLADNEPLLGAIGAVIATVLIVAIANWTTATWAQVTALWAQATAFAAAHAPLIAIVAGIALLVAGVIWAYQNWGWFRDAVDAVAAFMRDTLWPILQQIFGYFRDEIIPRIADTISWLIQLGINIGQVAIEVGAKAADIVNFIIAMPGRIAATVSTLWNGLRDGFTDARNWIGDKVAEIIGFFVITLPAALASLPSRFVELGRSIGRALVNGLIGIWNMIDFNVPSFTIPGWVPGIGGNSFGGFDLFPDVAPIYHGGGFTMGGASDEYWARLRGRELVVPLDMPSRAADLLGQAGLASNRPGINIGQVLVDNSVDFDDQIRRAEMLYDLGLAV